MGCVSISDSLGIVIAGCINWWLELCHLQVARGRDWCLKGVTIRILQNLTLISCGCVCFVFEC